MIFTWKATPTRSVYSSYAPPQNAPGPYPTRPPNAPETTEKIMLAPAGQRSGIATSAFYDPIQKSVKFIKGECTTVSTSLPTVCLKKLPRPLKIWRKRLDVNGTKSKVTLNQINGMGTSVTANPIHCIQTDIPKVIETIHIRRSGGRPKTCDGQLPTKVCMSTREYLQKRCKTFDQNQAKGQKVGPYTYKSGEASNDPLHCTNITVKPSNQEFKTQGGVSSSSRTNNLKYKTIQGNTANANYATARASLDTGYLQVKSQNQPRDVCITVRQDRAHETSCAYVKR